MRSEAHGKAQGAFEYMSTYSWALLVLAIAAAAIYFSGILNPNGVTTQQCLLQGGFSCINAYMGSNGVLVLNLQQTTGTPIEVTAVGCNTNQTIANVLVSGVYLPAGANNTFIVQCYFGTTLYSGTSGSKFSGWVQVNYTDLLTGAPLISFGRVLTQITGAAAPSFTTATTSTTVPATTTTSSSTTITTSLTTSTVPPLLAGSLTPSAPVLDNGQGVTLVTNPSGGVQPYSYLWYYGDSSTCSSDSLISGLASNTYAVSPASNKYYCYRVTDSQSNTATSVTDLLTVNPALGTPVLSPTNPSITSGNTVTLTASWPSGGGTQPYTLTWYYGFSSSCASDTFIGQTNSGLTTNTLSTPVTLFSSRYFCVTVVDSASTPQTTTSATDLVAVQLTLIPSNTFIDSGQTETLLTVSGGGTPPFTYNYFNITGSKVLNQYTGVSSTYNSYSFTAGSAGSFVYNVIITDSLSATKGSSSNTVVVSNALTTPTLATNPSLPSTQAAGNTIVFTASWTGGTSSYTVNYLITNSITGTLLTSQRYTGNSLTTNTFTWTIPSTYTGNTLVANVIVTDSATTPVTANSVKSAVLTVS